MLIVAIGIPIILYHLNNAHKINDTTYIDTLNKVSKYGLGKKFTQINENPYKLSTSLDYTKLAVRNRFDWISLTDKNLDWNIVLSEYANVNEVAKFILQHIDLYTTEELIQKEKDDLKEKEELLLSHTNNVLVDNLVNASILRYSNYKGNFDV